MRIAWAHYPTEWKETRRSEIRRSQFHWSRVYWVLWRYRSGGVGLRELAVLSCRPLISWYNFKLDCLLIITIVCCLYNFCGLLLYAQGGKLRSLLQPSFQIAELANSGSFRWSCLRANLYTVILGLLRENNLSRILKSNDDDRDSKHQKHKHSHAPRFIQPMTPYGKK